MYLQLAGTSSICSGQGVTNRGASTVGFVQQALYGAPMAPPVSADDLFYLPAGPGDHAVVVALMTELVRELDPSPQGARIEALLPEDTHRALTSPDIRLFIAWDDGVPVGLSRGDILRHDPIFRLRVNPVCGYVDQMYVRPSHRAARVGERLLACCEAWFKAQQVHHVLLHAAPKAVRFYARHGYQPNREMFKELD